jgi:hypothetical protein
MSSLSPKRVRELLQAAPKTRILVVGDVMLNQFIWGRVTRISPEAPVPVVEFERESYMPGGAANVARNLTSLGGQAELFGAVGKDCQCGPAPPVAWRAARRLLRPHARGRPFHRDQDPYRRPPAAGRARGPRDPG